MFEDELGLYLIDELTSLDLDLMGGCIILSQEKDDVSLTWHNKTSKTLCITVIENFVFLIHRPLKHRSFNFILFFLSKEMSDVFNSTNVLVVCCTARQKSLISLSLSTTLCYNCTC